jgi:hypothetical protein
VETCQIDAYSFLNYGGKVYNLLPSYKSGYMVAKFYLRAGYDNSVALSFSRNTGSSLRSEHIDRSICLLERK